jgi:[ribosomal protein S5]-alanine N-acetyltransferase
MAIETQNLTLIPADINLLQKAIEGNKQLAEELHTDIDEHWTEFGTIALRYVLEKLIVNPDEIFWWTYFPVYKKENKLIGSGGYKGKPEDDTVEIGYEIAPAYRNKGLATEMAKGLIDHAFRNKNVKLILAHTLGHENSSTKVLTKCGFEKVEDINDPDNGLIWKWVLKKKANISNTFTTLHPE